MTDPATYARYREAMTPMLNAYGGDFGCDFIVAEALRGVDDPGVNRVFTIGFPDQATKERFFADEKYLAVRAEFFAPSVGSTQILASSARSGFSNDSGAIAARDGSDLAPSSWRAA